MESLRTLEDLGRQIAAEQDAALAAVDLDRVRKRLLESYAPTVVNHPRSVRSGRPARLWVGAGVAALAVAAAAFVAINLATPSEPERLHVKVGGQSVEHEALDNWWSAPQDAPLPIEFSDGTKVSLEAKSRARVLQVSANGAHLVLESGASTLDVVPRDSSNWQVSAGPFLVQVVGTSFDIEWGPDDDLFVLKLHKGRVNLSGCVFGAGRSVVAGETVRASCKNRHYEIATRDSSLSERQAAPEPLDDAAAETSADTESAPEGTPAPALRAPSWRTLAQAGKYKEALTAATSAGFADTLARANAEDLALLGDAARYAGRPSQAILAYEKLRARFPGTARAATAAYSLARTHFDQRGAFAQAAQWFQIYLKERPAGPLAREAQGRLIESLNRAGNRQAAQRMAEAYLRRYPSGPHAALAKSLSNKNAQPGP